MDERDQDSEKLRDLSKVTRSVRGPASSQAKAFEPSLLIFSNANVSLSGVAVIRHLFHEEAGGGYAPRGSCGPLRSRGNALGQINEMPHSPHNGE